jgi:ketosteroid isomerase-like protein
LEQSPLSLAESIFKRTLIKSLLFVLAALMVFVTGALAQKQGTVSPLKSLVVTEQDFSQAAADKGTRPAFLQFIADDGILFRPKAVNGKLWMQDHPLPPAQTSEKRASLAWQPIFADVAEAGDLGYTTYKYGTYSASSDDATKKLPERGNYLRIWKKQNGVWRVVLDVANLLPAE